MIKAAKGETLAACFCALKKRKTAVSSGFSWWKRVDSLLNYRKVHRTFLPIGSLSASLLEFVSNPHLKKITGYPKGYPVILVEEGGFEPPKSLTADLQSAPFGRSGTLPYYGAGERT